MCIILTCDPNVRPSFDLLDTCFDNNPDGAGIMWYENGMVQTSKGFTTATELYDMILCVPENAPLCIHMRIATSGGIRSGTCHPFPVCDDLNSMHAENTECALAIMHNGVIPDMPTDNLLGISDTMSFTAQVVTSLYKRYGMTEAFKRHIRHAAPNNRFAVMDNSGIVLRIGTGWETITSGMYASNSSWLYRRRPITSWSWYDDPDDYETEIVTEWSNIIERYCYGCNYQTHCMLYGPDCFAPDDMDTLFTADDMEP